MILACSINLEDERSADCVLVDTKCLTLEDEHEQVLRHALELDDSDSWDEINESPEIYWQGILDKATIKAPAMVEATRMVFFP